MVPVTWLETGASMSKDGSLAYWTSLGDGVAASLVAASLVAASLAAASLAAASIDGGRGGVIDGG